MIDIKDNLKKIQETIELAKSRSKESQDKVLLLAVSKTRTAEEINAAIEAGITDIGENKVQEILEKWDHVSPVRWHMIGHLQRNKVKYIIDKVCMIHSVDSLKLAKEIDRRAKQNDRIMDVLIQVNVAQEESKFGVSVGKTEALIDEILKLCPNVRVCGLMTIPPLTQDPEEARGQFRQVKEMYDAFQNKRHEHLAFTWLSMGMSNDFPVAIEEGANIVRIGTAIFGARTYPT